MPAQNMIITWILQDNLRLFLERVFAITGCLFEDWDWDAIRFGVLDTDLKQDLWYTYELSGDSSVALAFANATDTEHLGLKAETQDATAVRIDALARILQCYKQILGSGDLETLMETAFLETPPPEQSKIVACDAAHLAQCPEHQEALSFFGGGHWISLLQSEEPLPRYYAGLEFLTPAARRFFFPAYLITAFRDRDEELLEIALERTAQEDWTPLQQELIDFTQTLLKPQHSDFSTS